MTRGELANIPPGDLQLFQACERATWRLVDAAKARLDSVVPTTRAAAASAYGYCLHNGKNRQIQLSMRTWDRDLGWSKREPSYVYIQTIAHEVAHLFDMSHGPQFLRIFAKMLGIAADLNLMLDIEKELS